MLLQLKRRWLDDKRAIGELYVGDAFECFSLEDAVREIAGVPVAEWKVPGQTAIPAGGYDVIITMSARFKKRMPLLLDVPDFQGIRIHCGNTEADTEGCILVGQDRGSNMISHSRAAFDALFTKIDGAIGRGEQVRIVISTLPELARASITTEAMGES